MKYKPDYKDGCVDLATKAAMSEKGVTVFRHPYLMYAAEKTGRTVVMFFSGMSRIFPRPFVGDKDKAEIAGGINAEPRTSRLIGGLLLSASSLVIVGEGLPEIPEAVDKVSAAADTVIGQVQEYIGEDVITPIMRFGRG